MGAAPAYQVHLVFHWDVWESFGQRRRFLTCTLRWLNLVLHGTVATHVGLGMGCIYFTGGMCYWFAVHVELSGLNRGSGSFRNVDEIYPYRALCVQSDSSSKMNEHQFWKWHLRTVGFGPDHTGQRMLAEFWCFSMWMDIGNF